MKLEERLRKFGDKVARGVDIGLEAASDVAKDAANKVKENVAIGSWKEDFDELRHNGIFQQMYSAVKTSAKFGKSAAGAGLDAVAHQYNGTLNDMVSEKPKLVGGIDGFYQTFTGKEVNRSRKQAYIEGKVLGKGVGWTVSAAGLYAGGMYVKAAAAVPIAVRAIPGLRAYVTEKLEEAEKKVDHYSAPKKDDAPHKKK